MTPFRKYVWDVELRNEVMGFAKSFKVVAINHGDAVTAAFKELAAKGYDDEPFVAISIIRKGFA